MAATEADAFTFIDRTASPHCDSSHPLFDKYSDLTSDKVPGLIIQLLNSLRAENPGHVVTYVNLSSLPLLAFAAEGHATATLDIESDSILRFRVWTQSIRRGATGHLDEQRLFARYNYQWGKEDYIVYVLPAYWAQFVLKKLGPGETQLSHSVSTDTLLAKVGQYYHKEQKGIYVYDRGWRLDRGLYDQMRKASWDNVILDPKMKKELTKISGRFFDSKAVYENLGVPWKRGLIFYGPAGNGKTISIKALMHTLADRKEAVPTLYVKAAGSTYHLGQVFYLARQMSPCLLVLEDIDTIVTAATRSYFFNEVDGIANNDGILMVASTNHIDQLDPGLSQRPSRFDRKYLFPQPSKAERMEYVRFWQRKLSKKPEVDFPDALVEPIAEITSDFSFAYMQEAFVASLLEMAHRRDDSDGDCDSYNKNEGRSIYYRDLDKYELWRVIKEQVRILRDEMDASTELHSSDFFSNGFSMTSNTYDGPSVNDGNILSINEIMPFRRAPEGRYAGMVSTERVKSPQSKLVEALAQQQSYGGLSVNPGFTF